MAKEVLKKRILAKIVPFLIVGIIRFLALLTRFQFNIAPQCLQKLENNEPFVIVFWHGELLFQPFVFQKFAKNKAVWVLISKHFDGEIISSAVRYFGIQSLRGSSSKGGIKALQHAIEKIQQNAYVVITPDGPRGPYHSVADGAVLLAQKTQVPVVVVRILYRNAWECKSWDKFKIPKPFSKVEFIIKEPFSLESMEMETARNYVKQKMEEDG